jgi:ADP-heptose:LPS heptosyltransferase
VLVARLDNAGDVLLAGPAVRAVAHSADRVCFLAGPHGAAAAALLPGVDEVAVMRAPWIDLEPLRLERAWIEAAVTHLAALRCDEAVILTSAHQSSLPLALLLRMAGVRRIGGISIDHAGALLDIRVAHDLDVHEVERGLSVARACGYEPPVGDDCSLRVRRTHAPPRAAPGFLLLHPGGTAPARCWPQAHWSRLVSELLDAGHRVVLTGVDAERALCQKIADVPPARERAGASRALNLAGETTFAEMVELVAAASCVVVANTGPAHIAAAVCTPVVSLFAPTVPASRWHPWRTPYVLLGDQEIDCAGCRAVKCPIPGHPCLETVSPAHVRRAVEALLTAAKTQPQLRVSARAQPQLGVPA